MVSRATDPWKPPLNSRATSAKKQRQATKANAPPSLWCCLIVSLSRDSDTYNKCDNLRRSRAWSASAQSKQKKGKLRNSTTWSCDKCTDSIPAKITNKCKTSNPAFAGRPGAPPPPRTPTAYNSCQRINNQIVFYKLKCFLFSAQNRSETSSKNPLNN